MRQVTLGSTGITVPQNGFGALPIQRVTKDEAVQLLQHAYAGGIHYFDTARAYSDSEEKLGAAFHSLWDKVFLATKTHAKTPAEFWQHLETSLRLLQTDCIDVYQFHCVEQCWRPGDGSGLYEAMLEARQQGKIRHIAFSFHDTADVLDQILTEHPEVEAVQIALASGQRFRLGTDQPRRRAQALQAARADARLAAG